MWVNFPLTEIGILSKKHKALLPVGAVLKWTRVTGESTSQSPAQGIVGCLLAA